MYPIFAQTGSISTGTLRKEDLIQTFMNTLEGLVEELSLSVECMDSALAQQKVVTEVGGYQELMGAIERRMEQEGYFDGEVSYWDLEELFDALSEFCPDNHYFGAHEGDGADFGFWPIVEE